MSNSGAEQLKENGSENVSMKGRTKEVAHQRMFEGGSKYVPHKLVSVNVHS